MRTSLLRKGTFFLNRETNSHALRSIKKKKKSWALSTPQNKQIFSWVSGSLERIKQAFLYWSCSRTLVLTSVSVPIYAAGFYTLTSGGHSNFRLLTRIFRKEGLSIPTPASGRGGMRIWICFQTTTLSLRWRYLKNQREKLHTDTHTHTHTHIDTHTHTHTVRARRLPHGVNMPVRRPSLLVGWNQEMTEAICGTLVEVSAQKELEIFCWSLGRQIW